MPCLYETLRIARRASLEEIKLAFKKIALEVHPDKGGNKEAFHQVSRSDCQTCIMLDPYSTHIIYTQAFSHLAF